MDASERATRIPVEDAPRIVAFDIESTGVDPEKDRIVELCLMTPAGRALVWRVNPGVPIPEAATRVHGIADADVADKPRFDAIAQQVQRFVEGAILLGYNSRSFDTLLLNAELRRAGQRGLDLDHVREIDVYRVWQQIEPRTLAGAAKRWLGEEHGGAHRARDDVAATLRVWNAMRERVGVSVDDGVRMTRPANEIDRHGKFVLDDTGIVVLNFGKHHGKAVSSVPLDYLEWMSRGDFAPSTKALVERLIRGQGDLPEARAVRERLASSSRAPAAR